MIFDEIVSRERFLLYLDRLDVDHNRQASYRAQEITETLSSAFTDYLNGGCVERFPLPRYYDDAVNNILKEANIHEYTRVMYNDLTPVVREVFVQRLLEQVRLNLYKYEKMALGAILIMWILGPYPHPEDKEIHISRWIRIMVKVINFDSISIPNLKYQTCITGIIDEVELGWSMMRHIEMLIYCFLMTLPRTYLTSKEYQKIFANTLRPGQLI